MTFAETERWRKCPSCGYLVPREAESCKRCVPAADDPATPDVPTSDVPAENGVPDGPAAHDAPPPAPGEQRYGQPAPLPPPAPTWPVGAAPAARAVPVGSQFPEFLPVHQGRRAGSPSKRLPLLVGAAFIVALLIAFGIGIFGFGSGHDYPSKWDAKVQGIAADVARIRGLRFEHPVPVQFMSDAAFRRDVGSTDSMTPADRRRLTLATRELRGLGLITGNVDLLKALKADRESRVLAYYSPERKVIVVRGVGGLDPAMRVTIAHEMTHVLQDQHFDLEALRRRVADDPENSADALRSIIEGDADRVEARYARALSAKDRSAYAESRSAVSTTADSETAAVPAILSAQSSAPYRYGPAAIDVLLDDGGNRAINAVMRRGVFNQQLFLDPTSVIDAELARHVRPPTLAKGERGVGEVSTLGAYEGYLLLASRISPSTALVAAQGWNGARSRTFRRDGDVCVRSVISGAGAKASERLGASFATWAAALPPGMATVSDGDGGLTTITSCDPGVRSSLTSPDAAIEAAGGELELNTGLILGVVKGGGDFSVARCLARKLLQAPSVRLVLALPEESITPEMVSDSLGAVAPSARRACGLE